MQFSQVVVEQDHKMVDVASKWFGLPAQITVHVGDGVEYVKKLASDVSSQGLSDNHASCTLVGTSLAQERKGHAVSIKMMRTGITIKIYS